MPILINLLAERSVLANFVQIPSTEDVDINAQSFRYDRHDRFCEEHALWSSKSAERSVTVYVSLADMAAYVNVRNIIAVVQMSDASIHDRSAHVMRESRIVVYIRFQNEEFPIIRSSNLPSCLKWMSLSAQEHVFVAI